MDSKKLKLKYSRKRLRHYFIFGVLWLIFGIVAVLFFSDNVFNYGYLILGIIYSGTFIFENTKQYITIENGLLTINKVIPKKMKLNDIKQIKKLAGDYVLISDSDKIEINIGFLEEESLKKMEAIMENLQLNTV
ncbi:MAG: hypothetical protein ABI295_00960 [Xanthomarina sp.]